MNRLMEFAKEIKRRFSDPIAQTEGEGDTITLSFEGETEVNHVIVMEAIAEGERVRAYVLEAEQQGQWIELVKGSTIGHKRSTDRNCSHQATAASRDG